MIKYKIFKLIHDYPIEIYLMWTITIFTAMIILMHLYCRATDVTNEFQFINDL